MKKTSLLILVVILGLIIWKHDDISQFIVQKIIFRDQYDIIEPNEYFKSEDFLLFQNTEDMTITSEDNFNNLLYTVLNSGWDSFSFFCDFSYDDCINDFKNHIQTSEYVEAINNYVDPFNSFDGLYISSNNFNKITIEVEKLYTPEQIISVNVVMDKFIEKFINDDMSDREKVKVFHDWIINNTDYDENFTTLTNRKTYPYHPYNAYGPLVEGYAVCSGYSDAMAIFLNKIGIKNYKISNQVSDNSTDGHVWNYALIDGKWYHIDLTWDDPITNDKSNLLIYDFFLVNTKQLEKIGTSQHKFNQNYYLETKNS